MSTNVLEYPHVRAVRRDTTLWLKIEDHFCVDNCAHERTEFYSVILENVITSHGTGAVLTTAAEFSDAQEDLAAILTSLASIGFTITDETFREGENNG